MRSIVEAMLETIYTKALETALFWNQTTGEKKDRYITLAQLEEILKELES